MVAVWICFCALLSCAGWLLSAMHALNRTGYAIVFTLIILAAAIWGKTITSGPGNLPSCHKLKRRFRRTFPLGFLVLATLAMLGGFLHAPNNYDALAYRVPRVLHWLVADQWHWIHTEFPRVNTRSCGIEWIMTPLIAFTNTDRWVFLINCVSFLLLPGLIFSLFTQIGVRRRVAWHWMWILPTGYCYLLQVGSIANDLFGAIFPLAALDFALRARRLNRASDAWLSMIAAALFTGAKTSNLPLLLPWLLAILPTWRLWLARPLAFVAGLPIALGASFVPMAILNWKYCGDWMGTAAEPMKIGLGPKWLYLFNNTVNLSLQNLSPPIFPFAAQWNQFAPKLIPTKLAPLLEKYCEPNAAHWGLGEMETEEFAGLGFGVTVLILISLIAIAVSWARSRRTRVVSPRPLVPRLVCAAVWFSFVFAMTKLGLSGVSRFFTPYFLLAIMGLLVSDLHSPLVRKTWWRMAAAGVFAIAATIVIASNARPLWPTEWVFRHYQNFFTTNKLGHRVQTVYEVYAHRNDALAEMRSVLPADIKLVGLVTADDPETSLWRPFGSRQFLHVRSDDPPEETKKRGIDYVFVKLDMIHEPWERWLERMNAHEIWSGKMRYRAASAAFDWRLVKLSPAENQKSNRSSPAP